VGRARLFLKSPSRSGPTGEARRRIPARQRSTDILPRAGAVRPASEPESRTVVGERLERLKAALRNHERILLVAAGVIGSVAVVLLFGLFTPDAPPMTQQDIDAAVARTLDARPPELPLATTVYASVARSVVRVRILNSDSGDERQIGVGTGVVIQDSGEILTNLHVVAGAPRLTVVFANGFESVAQVIAQQPEHDLAVLMPDVIPEELPPAVLGNSRSLRPGDPVVVVGHPFGIGPSVSAGIVSGLGRTDESADGRVFLTDLIQFDAAANPGNSGGPLLNGQGEVVGIVTSIVNPTKDAFFVGIGLAVPIEIATQAVGPNPF
jgi:S1-C subfamily serine protease